MKELEARYDGRVYASVSAEVKTKDIAGVSADVQKEIGKLRLPSGVDVRMGGVTEDIQESFTQLGLAMLAAVAIVYFVLVVTFGGGLAPFAILFSLPFAVIKRAVMDVEKKQPSEAEMYTLRPKSSTVRRPFRSVSGP